MARTAAFSQQQTFEGFSLRMVTGVRGTCDHERNLSDDQIKRIAERGGLIGIGYWDTAVCNPSLEGIVAALRHVADLVGVE